MFFRNFITLATLISCLTLSTNARTIHAREVEEPDCLATKKPWPVPGASILLPIRIDPLHHSLNRRSELPDLSDYSRLVPSDSELMMFGTPLDDGSYFIANLTLHAPPNTRILLMEKFEGLTRDVDCSTVGDHKLSVSFIDKDVFEYIQIWSWINEREENEFVMITNHEGCGPESQRAVFWVRKVDYVEEDLRADFYAVQTEWAEVAGTYSVDFGMMDMEYDRVYGPLQKRDPFDFFGSIKKGFDDAGKGIKKAAEGVGKGVQKAAVDAEKGVKKAAVGVGKGVQRVTKEVETGAKKAVDDVGKFANAAKNKLGKGFAAVEKAVGKIGNGNVGKDNVSLNLAVGKPGVKKNIYTDIRNPRDPRQIVDCLNCYVTGKIIMSGHLQFEHFLPKSAIFEARPQNLATMMKFRVFIKANSDTNGDGKPDPLTFERSIYSIGLPDLSVPGIFNLGPKAQLTVGFKSNVLTNADFSFGVKGSVPNTAVFRKDLINQNAPGTSNKWTGVNIEPLPFELLGGAIEMNFEASTNLIVGVGIQAVGIVSYEAGFKLKLPRIGVDLNTITNKNMQPACAGTANKSPTGIMVTSDVNIELVAMAGHDMMNGKSVQKQLWGLKIPLPKKCFPIKDSRGKSSVGFAPKNTPGAITGGKPLAPQAARNLVPVKAAKSGRPVNSYQPSKQKAGAKQTRLTNRPAMVRSRGRLV